MAKFSSSYADLYFGGKQPILSAGTRSGVVEEFEKLLCNDFPDKRWELKEATPLDGGLYRVSYLSIDKSKTNYNVSFDRDVYLVRRNSDGSWFIRGRRDD